MWIPFVFVIESKNPAVEINDCKSKICNFLESFEIRLLYVTTATLLMADEPLIPLSPEEYKRNVLKELGLSIGPRMPVPRSIRLLGNSKRTLMEIASCREWTYENMPNLYLEYQITRRWFWCIQFWERTLSQRMNRPGEARKRGIDQDDGTPYFETPYTAPLRDITFSTPYERHRENIHIFETIGAETYAFAVKAEKEIQSKHQLASLTSNLMQKCIGNDIFWPINGSETDIDYSDERNWGTLYVFPFPFQVIFIRDCTVQTDPSSPPQMDLFSLSQVLPLESRILSLTQFLTQKGFASVESYIKAKNGNDIHIAEQDRVVLDIHNLQRLVHLNTENPQVTKLAQRRLVLRVLNNHRVPMRTQVPWNWLNYRQQVLLVLNDFERSRFAYDSDETRLQIHKDVKLMHSYPLLVPGRGFFESNGFQFIPGVHGYLQLETVKSGVFQRIFSRSNRRIAFTSQRYDQIFERNQLTQCCSASTSVEDLYAAQINERKSQTAQLRSLISSEYIGRMRTLPYSFLTDVLFNPDISLEQFKGLRILFERLDEFFPLLENAISRQSQLRQMRPRDFVWFMFWYAFAVHSVDFINELSQGDSEHHPNTLLSRMLSVSAVSVEDPFSTFVPIHRDAVLIDPSSEDGRDFNEDVGVQFRMHFFETLENRLIVQSKGLRNESKLVLDAFKTELSKYTDKDGRGAGFRGNRAIERLYETLETDEFPSSWKDAKNRFLVESKLTEFPDFDAFHELKGRDELKEFIGLSLVAKEQIESGTVKRRLSYKEMRNVKLNLLQRENSLRRSSIVTKRSTVRRQGVMRPVQVVDFDLEKCLGFEGNVEDLTDEFFNGEDRVGQNKRQNQRNCFVY